MYYFKKNGERVEKYLVSFDKEQIEKLKQKIINKCSFIEHTEFESDYFPIFRNRNQIQNFKYTYVGKKEYFEETRNIYLFSYNEYKTPYLVELIDRLLKGESEVINEILNYDVLPNISIEDKMQQVNQELIEIDVEDISQKKSKLKELEKLLKLKELNKDQQDINLYYDHLIQLIKMDLVDSMTLEELNRVETFLGINLVKNEINTHSSKNEFIKILKK